MSVAWRYLSSRRRLPTSLSRPRREWWSFLCARRCSVSSSIRRVRSAIWTSGEPVSDPSRPNVETTSRFASFVSDIEPRVPKVRVFPGIAAGHPATADAGLEILAEGGTAADAAVAATLASCVAETLMTGLAGGGYAVWYDAARGDVRV